MKKKIFFSWMLVIICAGFIFFMSSMDANESNEKSKAVINDLVEKSEQKNNTLEVMDKHSDELKKQQIVNKLNQPLRKVAHASEYFVFILLIIISLKNSGIGGKKIFLIALMICFIYACTDEYHQTFVNGRTGQFTDSLIDTLGGAIGCVVFLIIDKIIKEKCKTIKKYSFKQNTTLNK